MCVFLRTWTAPSGILSCTPDFEYGVQAIIAKQAAAQKTAPKEVSESGGLLLVKVLKGENLTRLPDPYCLVFLTDEKDEPGEIVCRAEVVRNGCSTCHDKVCTSRVCCTSRTHILCLFLSPPIRFSLT